MLMYACWTPFYSYLKDLCYLQDIKLQKQLQILGFTDHDKPRP